MKKAGTLFSGAGFVESRYGGLLADCKFFERVASGVRHLRFQRASVDIDPCDAFGAVDDYRESQSVVLVRRHEFVSVGVPGNHQVDLRLVVQR